jgi:hypothetical protein
MNGLQYHFRAEPLSEAGKSSSPSGLVSGLNLAQPTAFPAYTLSSSFFSPSPSLLHPYIKRLRAFAFLADTGFLPKSLARLS